MRWWTWVCVFWQLSVLTTEDSSGFYARVTRGVAILLAAKLVCLLAPVVHRLQPLGNVLFRYVCT
jgi:hypothetical protein